MSSFDSKGTAPSPDEMLVNALQVCKSSMDLQDRAAALFNETDRILKELRAQPAEIAALRQKLHEMYAPAAIQRVASAAEKVVNEVREELSAVARDVAAHAARSSRSFWSRTLGAAMLGALLIVALVLLVENLVPSIDEVRDRRAVMSVELVKYDGALWAAVKQEPQELCVGDEPKVCGNYVRVSGL